MPYISTKTFEHAFSCAFRQWRANSHCRFLHGYALTVRIEFEAECLDDQNWVVDFGGLKSFKALLEATFDHKLVVAEDDPQKDVIAALAGLGVADVVVIPATGCERFAEYIFHLASHWLAGNNLAERVTVRQVEVSEHGANSAIFKGDYL